METKQLFGRKQIYTDVESITAENVVEVLIGRRYGSVIYPWPAGVIKG